MYAYSKHGKLNGTCAVPGSKSATIRATILGMLADGTTVIHNPLPSKDGIAAFNVARAMGAKIEAHEEDNTWVVEGMNGRPHVPDCVIDTMNSGTTTSFTIGAASLVTDGYVVITGDEQICRRPWGDEVRALAGLGAEAFMTRPGNECPPVVIRGPIHGGECTMLGHNSQHISGLLVPAALLPAGESVDIYLTDPKEAMYVQLTVQWLKRFGVKVENSDDFKHYHVDGGQKLKACECLVASDWSGVAFPLVAAAITDSELVITDVDFDDAQGDKMVADILIRMGADIEKDIEGHRIIVHGGKKLHGVEVDMDLIPDSLPILAVAAAFAEGDSHFTNLAHVRIKETDRVAVMQEVLCACGADVDITADSLTVHGGKKLHGAAVSSHDDHRVCMAMCVCGLALDEDAGEMKIDNPGCAAVSFPSFYELMGSVGADIKVAE